MKDHRTAHARESSGSGALSGTNPRHRILVAEDDTSILQFSTGVLIRSGYGVDAAVDGAAAWQALNTDSYDLLITDNNMPKISGVELVKKLRAARMALPVIMATGALPVKDFAQDRRFQPATMLFKPYTIAALLGIVKEVLFATDGARNNNAKNADLWPEALNSYMETNSTRRICE